MRRLLFALLYIATSLPTIGAPSSTHDEHSTPIQTIEYTIEAAAQAASSGDNTPYYHMANRQGIASITPNNGYLRASVVKPMDPKRTFDYGGGIDLVGAINHEAPFTIHQAYAEVQWECLDLMIGAKEYWSELRNKELSSGGTVWSGNARPIPQVRAGIFDFWAVPGTNGWLQIKGDASYGRFTDNTFLENSYGYQTSFITTDAWYHQKKLLLRSKEDMPFVFTVGMETAAQFGGTKRDYKDGALVHEFESKVTAKNLFMVLIPSKGDENSVLGDQAYHYGNHTGTWHAMGEYRLHDKSIVKGYFEGIFSDGSSIGRCNGLDGLWGIEWDRSQTSSHRWLNGIVIEYFQSDNQSGPIHYTPSDYSYQAGPPNDKATGADNYYNNFFYNGWTHWGQTAGTPLIYGTIYNTDGYMRILNNRVRALHLGVNGEITPELEYRLLLHYNKGWGTHFTPFSHTVEGVSAMIECSYHPRSLVGWELLGSFALDSGTTYGTQSGFMLKVRKSGSIINY